MFLFTHRVKLSQKPFPPVRFYSGSTYLLPDLVVVECPLLLRPTQTEPLLYFLDVGTHRRHNPLRTPSSVEQVTKRSRVSLT